MSVVTKMLIATLCLLGSVQIGAKPEANVIMDNARLAKLIKRIDPEVKGEAGYWYLQVKDKTVQVITDEKANRMRIIIPVAESSGLNQQALYRLMQANFDSALDARYAIAKGVVWSTFIHPLNSLTDHDFLLGLGQVVNLVDTYGTSFSSGALQFQGGDSRQLQRRQLIDELLDKGLGV